MRGALVAREVSEEVRYSILVLYCMYIYWMLSDSDDGASYGVIYGVHFDCYRYFYPKLALLPSILTVVFVDQASVGQLHGQLATHSLPTYIRIHTGRYCSYTLVVIWYHN